MNAPAIAPELPEVLDRRIAMPSLAGRLITIPNVDTDREPDSDPDNGGSLRLTFAVERWPLFASLRGGCLVLSSVASGGCK